MSVDGQEPEGDMAPADASPNGADGHVRIPGVSIQRYKGLGEMNPQQLWETTMDASTRSLKRIDIEDAVAANQMFSVLMGDEVEPRKEFILQHAKEVKELDV